MTTATSTPPAASAPRLVLASGSPRRRYLLHHAGIAFEVKPADIPEEQRPGEAPEAFARRLAREKAVAIARRTSADRVVLGSDTIVVLDGDVLGKPRDKEHAIELLSRLLGQTHSVITAVAVAPAGTEDAAAAAVRDFAVVSSVTMRDANAEEIRAYVAGGEPMDKAGAYALQGEGRRFVEHVEGSDTNVIGLPIDETLALLRDFGVDASTA